MRIKTTIILILLAIALSVFFFAESKTEPDMNDPVIKKLAAELAEEGYEIIEVESTWLGRIKVEAHSPIYEREIVLAPGAGTFLRDDISRLKDDDADDN